MHLRKLPSGKWRVIVKHHGLQRTATATTKAQASALGAALLLDLGKAPTGGTATLGDMLEIHLTEQGYSATALYDLRLVVNKLPDDVLGWRVSTVEPFTVEQLYKRLRKDGWSAHRLQKLHMLLSSAWTNRAGEYGWSSKMLMRSVRRPKVDTPEVRPPPTTDVRTILAAVNRGVALFLRLSAVTGARRGELCGLQWHDIDLTRHQLTVRRSVAHVPDIGLVVTEGKTGRAGHRVIGIDPETSVLLAVWHAEVAAATAELGLPSARWVFSHDRGVHPWRGDYISREFRIARERSGVEDVHLHSLRHYMATEWLRGGEAAMTVASRLGHANPATTLKTYAHYIGATDHEQAAKYAL